MAMITRQDMLTRFGERELILLTDRNRSDTLDEAVLQHAIDDAEAEAAAYLQAAGITVGTPPPVLVLKLCDMARYYLYEDGVSQIVEDRYKQAVSWLREVVRNPRMLDADALATDGRTSRAAVLPNRPDEWASF